MNDKAILNSVLGDVLTSFAERDKSMDISAWLENKLAEEMPEKSVEDCKKLATDIFNAVGAYNQNLEELNSSGYESENWLAEKITEDCKDIPIQEAGKTIERLDDELFKYDAILANDVEIEISDKVENTEFNEYTIHDKARAAAEKMKFAGLDIAAKVLENKMKGGKDVTVKDSLKEVLRGEISTNKDEVKAAVAGAVKIASEKGLKHLDEEMSTETIGCMAGAAVESASILLDATSGSTAWYEVPEKIAKAVIAGGGNLLRIQLELLIAKIPLVGGLVSDLLGGLLDHVTSTQFVDNVYVVVRDAAKSTWEHIKESMVGRFVIKNIGLIKNKLKSKRQEKQMILTNGQ